MLVPVSTEEHSSSAQLFTHGDLVRLKREFNGIAEGSEGAVIGWPANRPESVLVLFRNGGGGQIPTEALELAT